MTNNTGINITSTIINLAMENLITNSQNKIIEQTPTVKEINKNNLNFKVLIAILLLLIYIISAPIFLKKKFYLLHQSGLCMLLGMLISLITKFITPFENYNESLKFNDNIFFTFILPPIIFSAGYNIKVKTFFKYFHYSVIFGILGTFMSFAIILCITYFSNKLNLFKIYFNMKDILLYSAVISSTDTVSPLTFISETNKNKLFEVLFGEGIMNDSFSIVIFQIITKYYGTFTSWQMLFHFINSFFMSCFLGIAIGMLCSHFLKKLKQYQLQSVQEISIIIIFAFFSYIIAELSELSAILSLLFCSITLSNYAFFNLSFLAREQSCIVVKIMASFSEGFIFAYLGLSFWTMIGDYDLIFQCIQLLNIIFARLITVYLITGVNNLLNDDELLRFDSDEKKIISLSGCIRGAIAFGLSMTIETGDINKNSILLSSTLVLVLITTFLFGPFIPHLLKKGEEENLNELYNSLLEEQNYSDSQKKLVKFEHPNNEYLSSLLDKSKIRRDEEPIGLGNFLYKIDRQILKPLLVDDWENTINEHVKLNRIIKNELNKQD